MTTSHETLLTELRIAVERDHRTRRRHLRVATAMIAMILIGAGTVAAATQAPWWDNAAPPVNPWVVNRQLAPQIDQSFPPTADPARARTVAELDGATLVAAPVGNKDGYCLIPALPGSADIGFSCEYQLTDEVRAYARPAPDPRWIIYGRFTDERAATLDMSDAVGASLRVTLQPGGFFIAELPKDRWSALDNGAGSAVVLDSNGKTLASVCLNFGPSPSSADAGQTRWASPLNAGGCVSTKPIPMAPVLSKARKLVELKLHYDHGTFTAGTTIALYVSPNRGSDTTCRVIAPVPMPTDGRPGGAGSCGATKQTSAQHPLNVMSSSALDHGNYDHLVTGQVDPSLDAVRVEVQVDGATTALALANDNFIGELAPTDSTRIKDAFVVAYNTAGTEVARQKLR
jgi:hypothetical protein